MKAKEIRRITIVVIAFVMVIACLWGALLSVTTIAYAATTPAPSASARKTDYITTDRKPTYTDTLNENNRLLQVLEEKINGNKENKENKVLSFSKKYGKDIIDETFSILNTIKRAAEGGDVDWEKFGVDLAKSIIVSIAGAYGFGGVADSLLNGIEALLTSGEAPLSEIEILSDDINKQFNKMSDQLYDIEDQIGALANDVKASVKDILNGTSSQIEALDAKQILRAFMSRGEGNFSYTQFQNYIYGSTRNANPNKATAYYNQLIEAIVAGADDSVIQYYYNKLFDSIQSSLTIFREYYLGEVDGLDKSITKYYYDYLSANPSLIPNDKTAEYLAIEFAYDLYSTYVFSYEIIKLCYSYQISEMYIEESLKGAKLNTYSKYKYNATDYIYYGVIKDDIADIETYMNLAEEMVVSDLAYIYRLGESYTVSDANGNIHDITKYGDTFGNVAREQTIYLNKISDSVNEIFELDADNYSYYVNDIVETDKNKFGVVKVKDVDDSFRASVKYGNKTLYTIDFSTEVKTAFSGGSGAYDDPYLISNKHQFLKISEKLNACYELIANLDLGEFELTPIGTYDNPFDGILQGNGYTISHLNINSLPYDERNITLIPTTGLFGTIGRFGIVENLNIEDIRIISDYNVDGIAPESDTSAYYVGAISGYNCGNIYNCSITNDSSITVNRNKRTRNSRNVEVYVGGITGINLNNISYCTVDSMVIDATSTLNLHAESVNTNKNSLLVAGITATTTKTVSNCRVGDNVKLSAYAKSTANTSNRVKPYVTVKTGGIIADESASSLISAVYAGATTTKCRGEIYNEGTYWGEHRFSYDNVTIKDGTYYPAHFWFSPGSVFDNIEQALYGMYSKELKEYLVSEGKKAEEAVITKLGNKIIADYNNTSFVVPKDDFDVSVADSTVYEINIQMLNRDTLLFTVNGKKVEDVRIINYYGFNSYNEDQNTVTNTVRIFFVASVNGKEVLLYGDVDLTIAEDRIIGDPVVSGLKTEYSINETKEEAISKLFAQGFTILYYHANGKMDNYYISTDNRNDVEISDFNILDCDGGEFTFTIIHNGNTIKQTATVICNHVNLTKTGYTEATCQSLGYEIWTCDACHKEFNKNYTISDHHYIVENGAHATCFEPGYTRKVFCDVCGTIVVESEWIQTMNHDYISIEDAINRGYNINNKYSESVYHYCVNGNHYEPHQYLVTENTNNVGKLVYTYTCRECGHWYDEIDDNLITNAEGKLPTVFVTDGYVLNVGDEVVVYVQLLNNPGFNGANFGIRYSDGLELISSEEGTIIPNALSADNEVYKGYNYLWAKKDKENWTEDGYILKLVFKVTSETKEDQTVEVVYAYQKITYSNGKTEEVDGGFATTFAKYGVQKFLTHSGTISFVDHLPGDINEDKVVDIKDAMNIAWGLVGKKGVSFKKQYADVNLDGTVDLNDVIWILQSVSGNYGINLLNYKYYLQLNLNGYDTAAFDKLLTIYFYDEEGEINNWNSQISFEEYEQEMNRKGYTFIGWYTRLIGGEKIDITQNIQYDPALGTQTLYAHWAKNSIHFEMSGAREQIQTIEYQPDNYVITLSDYTPEFKYDVEYSVVGFEGIYQTGTIYKVFDGWYLNGGKVFEIDLSVENLGNITLIARWSTNYVWEMPIEKRAGYNNITNWYWQQQYDDNHLIGADINDEVIDKMIKNSQDKFVIYGQPNYIKYTINYDIYGNNQYDSDCLKEVSIADCNTEFSLAIGAISIENLSDVSAYKFEGWYANGKKISSINKNNIESIFGNGTSITLTAKWYATAIEITIMGINEDKYINSSYPETRDIATIYYCYGDDTYDPGYYQTYDLFNGFSMPISKFTDIKPTPSYTNFDIKGCYSGITNNGHSYAVTLGKTYFNADGTVTTEKPNELTFYAYCRPKQNTITFDINHYGLLENALTGGSYSGNNLNIEYNADSREYILTPNGTMDDPYCTIGQYVYLEAGKTYYAHMTVSSKETNAVQMFYTINGEFSEGQSMHFDKDHQQNTFNDIDTSGIYKIRFDNDTGESITITNFWITEEFTHSKEVYYNETIGTVKMPKSRYYVPQYSFGSKLYDDLSEVIYNNSEIATLKANWNTQVFDDYTYICNADDLSKIKTEGKYKYMIITDIDCGGKTLTPTESFSGELLGTGNINWGKHAIYNFIIEETGTAQNINVGLFRTNSGTIKDLTIGKNGITSYDEKYSVKYNINYTEGSGESYLMVGGFVGKNSGTITGCQLVNTYINAKFADKNNDKTLFVYVGGIVGYNDSNGMISDCHVKSMSNINVEATAKTNSGDNNDGFLGGICGENHANIDGCSVQNTTLNLIVRGDGKSGNKAYPKGYLGGIVGSQYSGTLSGFSVSGNKLSLDVSSGKYTDPIKKQGDIYGRFEGGKVSES